MNGADWISDDGSEGQQTIDGIRWAWRRPDAEWKEGGIETNEDLYARLGPEARAVVASVDEVLCINDLGGQHESQLCAWFQPPGTTDDRFGREIGVYALTELNFPAVEIDGHMTWATDVWLALRTHTFAKKFDPTRGLPYAEHMARFPDNRLPPKPRSTRPLDRVKQWEPPNTLVETDEAVRFIVQDVIQAGHAGTLTAQGGTGKTTVMLYLMCCTATGRPFGGHAISDPGRSVLLSLDDPQDDLDRALCRVAESFSPEDQLLIRERVQVISLRGAQGGTLVGQEENRSEFRETDFAAQLIAHFESMDDLRLVGVDTLGQFSNADSSDEAAMKAMLRVAGRIAEVRARPAVILPHHVTKDGARNKVVDQYSARGSAAITDNSRFALHLSLLDKEDRQQLRMADGFDQMGADILMVTPTRGSLLVKKVEPFYLRRNGFLFETLSARAKSAEERLGELDQQVLDFVATENRRNIRPSRGAVRTALKKRADETKGAIDRLVARGLLGGSGDRSSQLYLIDQG